jgi:DNA repair protein RecN (Recombination protein N)
MLTSLHILNYALIEDLTASFPNGLVILTGETGAGKSIIIDALGLVIGERANAEGVRAGSERAVVEAVFDTSGNARLNAFLRSCAMDPTDELIVRREISRRGQSRCFVNDSPVTLSVLKQIGEFLVDLHGQHEHQSLLRSETHIAMLDESGGLEDIVGEYQQALGRMRSAASELADLRKREQQLMEKREFTAFQLSEIDAVAPRVGEEGELEEALTILENAERLFSATGELYEALYGGERSVHDVLVLARNQLQDLAAIDRQFAEAGRECAGAVAVVAELARFVQSYNAGIEFAPERLEELRDRLGRLSLLKKKFGGSLDAVLARRDALASELALAENFAAVIQKLAGDVEAARGDCALLAERLSAKRHDVARRIDKGILAELARLGMPDAKFTTRITRADPGDAPSDDLWITAGGRRVALHARGVDQVEFYISTNVGEDERPLAKVASGGEVSRIMLGLKSILAKSDRLPVLIFDEIDVGVSGRIAQAVGKSLKSLSSFHQVVAITHLPQIAGLADAHFVVSKSERKGRATTQMRRLSLEEQVTEVAKLMSGADVTETARAGARELMGINRSQRAS